MPRNNLVEDTGYGYADTVDAVDNEATSALLKQTEPPVFRDLRLLNLPRAAEDCSDTACRLPPPLRRELPFYGVVQSGEEDLVSNVTLRSLSLLSFKRFCDGLPEVA